ncbi:MAG: 3'-5' exonuclease [Cyclobacteriaceae bacterium]|nr:3'-5' exonuclease [Cyclobacteriaceae bacterium]
MHLNLKNPLVIFDLETTGTNVVSDRIVEISLLKISVNNSTETKTLRINPEMPIPLESSIIHGIYDADIADAPTWKQMAKSVFDFIKGADLAGFNVIKFDIPLLAEEFLRVDIPFDVSKRKVIDAQRIFHLMEKRTLSAAYKFYCNKDLNNAHSAEADTVATYEVLKSQIAFYENQKVVDISGKEIGQIKNDMDMLDSITRMDSVDLANRLTKNNQGQIVFNFGKYKGQVVTDVLKKDVGYYDWMMKGDFALDTKRKLTQIKLDSLK